MAPLSGTQTKMLIGALSAAFPTYQKLKMMLALELDRRLADYAAAGPMPDVVFEVIGAAESEGWTRELVTGACLHNPGNPALQELVAGGQLDTALAVRSLLDSPNGPARTLLGGGVLTELPAPELQRILNAAVAFQNPVGWATQLLELTGRVCLIEVTTALGKGSGTGFLVGPDLVLTNHHVLADVLDGAPPSGVRVTFDHRVTGTSVEYGRSFALAAQWRVADSPPSAVDLQPDPIDLPRPDELDYALVRLDGAPGAEPAPGHDVRGWLDLWAEAPPLVPGLPLLILQHPAGNPVKLALDTPGVHSVNANGTRVTYGVNTLPGSSGSPCFALDLRLVAQHHAGAAEFGVQRNEGVPVAAIAAHLRASGRM